MGGLVAMTNEKDRSPAYERREGETPSPEVPTDWKAVYEAQLDEGESSSKGGFLENGLAKIGCGCALPLLFLLGTCGSLTDKGRVFNGGPAFIAGQVTGMVIVGIMLCWLPLFLFWLRQQSKWIIALSFAAIAGWFAITGLAKIGNDLKATADDAASFADIKFDKDGVPIIPPGMEQKGPMSKFVADLAREQHAIRVDFDAEIKKLNVEDMMLANRVNKNPSLVRNCDRILAFRTKIDAFRQRNVALIENGPQRIDALDAPFGIKDEMKRGYANGRARSVARVSREWQLQSDSMVPLHRSCLILSKRQWQAQGATFAFNNNADMSAFNDIMKQLDTMNAELAAINKGRLDQVTKEQQKLREQVGAVR